MNKENNIISSFFFSKHEYLYIFGINSLLTLNDFINTHTSDKIASITLLRIFSYGMFEYQKSIILSPDIAINSITRVIQFVNKSSISEKKIDKIYRMCLNVKTIEEYEDIIKYIEE
jgi:hypothetical protein